MTDIRALYTATLLFDGQVLVTGGRKDWKVYLSSCELYNPSSGSWSPTGSMNIERDRHTAVLLQDGKVLVAGGTDGTNVLSLCELYDPGTGTWELTDTLNTIRRSFDMTLLPDGRVLAVGGYDGLVCLTSCEIYEPYVGPNIVVSDTLHDFGVVVVGGYKDWSSLWIRNVGDSVLTVLGMIPSNTAFSIVSPSFPTDVNPSDSLQVTARFSPADTIIYTGDLTIHSNDVDEPQVKVHISGRGVGVEENYNRTLQFTLFQNYPNPVVFGTFIEYCLPKEMGIRLKVYDVTGREARRLVVGRRRAGYHRVCWDRRSDSGEKLAPGIYFYKIEAERFKAVKKLTILR